MKKNKAEKILSEAVKQTTPDIFDSILSECECALKEGKVINMDEVKNNKSTGKGWVRKAVATAAAIAIIAGCGLGFGSFQKARAAETAVSVDAGSDVTVGVNRDNVVVSVSDNAAGISKADVKGKDVKEAVGAIVDKMVKNGEITNENNIVLISVEAIKQKAAEGEKEVADEVDEEMTDAQKEMQEELADAVDEVLDELGINGAVIGQSFDKDKAIDKIAKEFSISTGKVSFIKKVLDTETTDEKTKIGDLAGKSISEIVQFAASWLSEAGIEVKDGDVTVNVGTDAQASGGNVSVNVGTDANVSVGTDSDGSFGTHVNADNGNVKVDVNAGADYSLGIEVDGESFVYDSSDPTGSIIGIIGSIIKAS